MQISKFNKVSFSAPIDTETFSLSNLSGMTISHYSDATVSSFFEVPFALNVTENQVVFLCEADYFLAMREKVDLSVLNAVTPIEDNMASIKNNIPYTPVQLDNGFIELKGED